MWELKNNRTRFPPNIYLHELVFINKAAVLHAR